MSIFYSVAYMLGFTPWENAASHPAATEHIEGLFREEESGRERPFGKALDVGCGRGHWAIVLARRGWQVTGIDVVGRAVRAARRNAAREGVEVNFAQGDITDMQSADVGSGFDLFWDFGTIHGLDARGRLAIGREITAVAAPDAVLLMLAWSPGKRGFLPRGLAQSEIETMFPGWHITDIEPFDTSGLPKVFQNVKPKIYRLQLG